MTAKQFVIRLLQKLPTPNAIAPKIKPAFICPCQISKALSKIKTLHLFHNNNKWPILSSRQNPKQTRELNGRRAPPTT